MQVWEFFVYASVVIGGPSILKAYFLVSEESYRDMLLAGFANCLFFAIHPCVLCDSHLCPVCRFARERRCKLLKHWVLFVNIALLLTMHVAEAVAPVEEDGIFWGLLLLCGQSFIGLLCD